MRRWAFVLLLPLLLAQCTWLAERRVIEKCQFSLEDVGITRLGVTSATLEARVTVKNPNPVAAVIDRFTYDFFINDHKTFSGVAAQGLRIPSGQQARLTATIEVRYADLAAAVLDALRKRSAHYKLAGQARMSVPWGTLTYPVVIQK